MKTIVAYTLKGEDHTAELVAKQGLFWLVTNAEKGEHKIPAKAVEETWDEAEEPTEEEMLAVQQAALEQETPADLVADLTDMEPATPSLADQAMAGPVVTEPGPTITLAELCDTYGVVARIARRKLREAAAAGKLLMVHQHREGWVFDRNPENIDAIMALITARVRG